MTVLFTTSTIQSGTSGEVTPTVDSTGCNAIIVCTTDYGGAPTDNKGNTYTRRTGVADSAIYICESPTVGTGHTFGGTTYHSLTVIGIDDADIAGGFVDGASVVNNVGSSITSISPGSKTPTAGSRLFVASVNIFTNGAGTEASVDSSFTRAGFNTGISGQRVAQAGAYLISSAGTAQAPTFSWSTASSGGGAAAMLALKLSGADTTPPVITGPSGATGSTSSKSIPENTTAVHTFTANETVTWDLNGGTDVALFTINSSTGSLAFLAAPNFEAPADADTNNTYVVGVRATDAASNATTQTLTVTVTDVDETSPNLSAQTATSAAPLTCQGSVTTNEATGTLYVAFTASATAPSAAQVKLGQDHTGAAALRAVSQAVSATGAQTIASGAVTAGTRFMHAMHEDATTNQSSVVTTSSFVVAASYGFSIVVKDNTGTPRASYAFNKVYAIRLSDNVLAKTWTAPSTDGSGNLTLADAALTAVPHAIVTVETDGTPDTAGAAVITPS